MKMPVPFCLGRILKLICEGRKYSISKSIKIFIVKDNSFNKIYATSEEDTEIVIYKIAGKHKTVIFNTKNNNIQKIIVLPYCI